MGEERKNICIFSDSPRVGGGQLSMLGLALSALKDAGYGVSVFFPSRSFKDLIFFKRRQWMENNIRFVSLPSLARFSILHYVLPAFFIKKDLRKFDFFFAIGGSSHAAIPFLLNKRPYIAWTATPYLDEWKGQFKPFRATPKNIYYHLINILSPLFIHIKKKCYRKAKRIFCISEYTKSRLSDLFKIDKSRIGVLPYLVDTDKYKPGKDLNLLGRKYILSVGKMSEHRKNFDLLLDVFAGISKEIPDRRLVAIGRYGREQIAAVRKRHLVNKVTLIDFVDESELIKYYQNAELLMHTSNQEGLGIVILEAMACGLPVLSTACGGPRELIKDGHNGFLAPCEDADSLKQKALLILKDESLKNEISQKALKFVRDNYSKRAAGPGWLDTLSL
jgi:glycosyltransferase involved in cell wall biosynthesis